MSARTDAIVDWLRQHLGRSGARGFVIGLSGGVDSAVVARLCQIAASGNVLGVLMPCHSDPGDEADARAVADLFGLPIARIDLAPAFDLLTKDLIGTRASLAAAADGVGPAGAADMRARVPAANVKPRLRMTTLYYLANTLEYLVAGTGNRSELAIGYFTKYGDGGADLLPIGDLLKHDVRALARELGIPDAIVDKAPSAGLWAGQTDEAEMGFGYAELDRYLGGGPETVAPALAMRIERLIRRSGHKRALPPTPADTPVLETPE
jgi:NAD+ synthase